MKRRPLPGVIAVVLSPEDTAAACDLQAENERLRSALEQIEQWAHAYPEEVFLPVSDEQVRLAARVLREAGISMGGLHGSWARHIVEGIDEIARSALIPGVASPQAAACEAARERVIRAAVAHVAARKDWDARGGYAPIQRQSLHGTMDELVAAVEEMHTATNVD
jgi:cytochrome c5